MQKIISGITGHMIVKNEDQWVWFAVKSILPYVDTMLITDTGSTDNTIKMIKSIKSGKIIFKEVIVNSSSDVTRVREQQLEDTRTDWFWAIDGDEIYSDDTAREVVKAIKSGEYEGVTVRRYDLLGDIYHRQLETIGEYKMFGTQGHIVLRALNISRLPGLHLQGDYPLEGYYDGENIAIVDHDKSLHYITSNYLYHAMYLKRSSSGSNLPMFNRSKYKIESGIEIGRGGVLPPVFYPPRPIFVPDPLVRRGLGYELLASVITPIKNIKRKL